MEYRLHENVKQAKQYLDSGKISKEDFGEEDKNIRNFLLSVNEVAKDYKKDDVDKQDVVENVIDMIENFSEDLIRLASRELNH